MNEYNGKELIVMACSNCNINCEHCYISYSGNRTPEELLEIVKTFKNKYDININGAEILTNINYLEAYKENNQPFILTNGKAFLTNKDLIKELEKNSIKSISLSYHFGIQDELSPIKEEDLNKIISIIKNNGLEFRLLTTITTENYNKLDYMCKKAQEIGARGIKFTNFINQGNGKNMNKNIILSQEQIDEFFKLLNIEREKYDKEKLLIERCGSFGKNKFSTHDNFNCNCIDNSVVLTPDNNIYPCIFLAQQGYEIGKYIDNKIYIFDEYLNDHTRCLAKEACNNNAKVLVKKGIKI